MTRCTLVMRFLDPAGSAFTTGLALLSAAGEIRLKQVMQPAPAALDHGPWHLRDKAESAIELHIEGRGSLYVDTHDSWEIDAEAYDRHDIYLKRSHDPSRTTPEDWPRVRAMGLICEVRPDGIDLLEPRRMLGQPTPMRARLREFSRFLMASAAAAAGVGPRPTLARVRRPPAFDLEPRVLFMAGVWDPAMIPPDAADKAEEFEAINEMRMQCVRRLRRAFGRRFFGGIQHGEFARRRYPDVLLENPRDGSKGAYLARVPQFPVCVATTGLHGSNGWKLAEYVGLSRSVVSEPLRHAVPGGFAPRRNYLEFTSPETCVEQAGRLMDSPDLRRSLMQANWQYYDEWMRPDALARRAIEMLNRSAE